MDFYPELMKCKGLSTENINETGEQKRKYDVYSYSNIILKSLQNSSNNGDTL